MHNLGDDKELDRLSREAAGGYTPPGAPNWDALSNELDKVMPVEEKKRRFIFWWLLPVLLAGGATTYWLTQKDAHVAAERSSITTSSTSKDNTAAPAIAETKENKDVTPGNTSSELTSAQTQLNSITANQPTRNSAGEKNFAGRGNSKKLVADKNNFEETAITNNNTSKTNSAEGKTNGQAVRKENETTATNPSKDNNLVTGNSAKEPVADKTNPGQTKTDNSNTATSVTEKKTEPTSPEKPAVADTPANKKGTTPLQPRGKGFSFAGLAGVDESTVKFKYGNNAGFNVGVVLGYHFSDKLSVHTGAVYTQKKYKVAGTDFTPPKGTMISYYKIEDVNGSCNMWEFPLLARYTFSQGKKMGVFASTGLSSYLMTGEDYFYRYYNNSNVLTSRYAAYYTGNTYFMSVLHLSAGFENRMGKNLSLIIEPYAKLPLAGVGFGSIRLSSFGLNFSVQYRQPAKK